MWLLFQVVNLIIKALFHLRYPRTVRLWVVSPWYTDTFQTDPRMLLLFDILSCRNCCNVLRRQRSFGVHSQIFFIYLFIWNLCSRQLLITWWQKEKLLIMSKFFFCVNIFSYSFTDRDFSIDLSKCHQLKIVCGNGLTIGFGRRRLNIKIFKLLHNLLILYFQSYLIIMS